MWEVEFTEEFEKWWNGLDADEQESVAATVGLIEQLGPRLPRPHSDTVKGSKHAHMKKIRTQHQGRPIGDRTRRTSRRMAILLIGGDKTGDSWFYDRMVPLADKLYDEPLKELKKEGLLP